MYNQIILASGSRQRRLIMDALGLKYKIIPADIDEKAIRDENLEKRAENIAKAKAMKVAKNNDGIIISADTFAFCDGRILEKPENLEEAKEMLRLQSNNEVIVYTGFCYLDKKNNIEFNKTSISKLILREMSDNEIEYYVNNNPVLQWSAAYTPMYLYQSTFIKHFEGSITGVSGIPVEFLAECLEKSKVNIKGSSWNE